MATHAREGLDRLLRGSVAEDLARHAQLPTLFLPLDVPGFVDKDSGRASIRNVLIPIDHKPIRAQRSLRPLNWSMLMAAEMRSCTCFMSAGQRMHLS